MVNVFITVDTEIWCGGWDNIDQKFPDAFEKYILGPTPRGHWALPKKLDILQQHGLKASFFVEPLFSLRFGAEPLQQIVQLINQANQEIQLHLHTEWVDEALQPVFESAAEKKQFLYQFSVDQQQHLLELGTKLLKDAGAGEINAFRAGSYGANLDTMTALKRCGITIDTSYNPNFEKFKQCFGDSTPLYQPGVLNGVHVYPVTVFNDTQNPRHLQLTACSFDEFRFIAEQAEQEGWDSIVLVSHNFELMNTQKTQPNRVVTKRFEKICRYLADNRDRFNTVGFNDITPKSYSGTAKPFTSSRLRTLRRLGSQALSRLAG